MMKHISKSRYRSLLVRGASTMAITFLLLCATGCRRDRNTDTQVIQPTTTEVSTTCTTTSTSTTLSTTTTTATETMTTSMAATSLRIETTQPMTETAVSTETEPAIVNDELPITEYERILLCNVVAREYGSDWVAVSEKAKVVAVVMNRVNSPLFPNTIEGVLTQPQQFSGYWACNYEWSNVTQSVRDAVDYYFAHTDEFGNWLYFWGDGTWNHFS